jgi:hypothetical protein
MGLVARLSTKLMVRLPRMSCAVNISSTLDSGLQKLESALTTLSLVYVNRPSL